VIALCNPVKRGLGEDESDYNQSRLWSRLHNTLAQITRIIPQWIYTEYTALKTFSPFRIFEHLALALKNRVCPNKISLCWIYFLPFKIFGQLCACPEKQNVPWIHCIEYIFFIIQDFWATCACPESFQAGGAAAPRPPPRTSMLKLYD